MLCLQFNNTLKQRNPNSQSWAWKCQQFLRRELKATLFDRELLNLQPTICRMQSCMHVLHIMKPTIRHREMLSLKPIIWDNEFLSLKPAISLGQRNCDSETRWEPITSKRTVWMRDLESLSSYFLGGYSVKRRWISFVLLPGYWFSMLKSGLGWEF